MKIRRVICSTVHQSPQRLLVLLLFLISTSYVILTLYNDYRDVPPPDRRKLCVTARDGQGEHPGSIKNPASAMRLSTPPSAVTKKRRKKIYAVFRSRYGNVLFQFAAIYGLAMDTNSESHIQEYYETRKMISMFPSSAKYIHLVECIPENVSIVEELAPNRYTHKVKEKISDLNNDVYIEGWLGAWGYWWPKYEKQLRKIFKISEQLQNRAIDYLFKIATRIIPSSLLEWRIYNMKTGILQNTGADGLTLVGIQSRRGDKLYSQDGWQIPGLSYFIHAMDYFKSKYNNTYFIVVSEDKEWAKANITGANVVHSSSKDDLLELTLLSLCDHTIMSVGTFSWWAAWLADGETVYYKHHTKANTVVASFFNDSQYFLPHWIPMD